MAETAIDPESLFGGPFDDIGGRQGLDPSFTEQFALFLRQQGGYGISAAARRMILLRLAGVMSRQIENPLYATSSAWPRSVTPA